MPNEEISAVLEGADILLNPANADNMPINLSEAFTAGVPVATTIVGGIPDLVGQGEPSLTIIPNDAVSMAARIEHLLTHPQTVVRVTAEGKLLCERFNWQKVGRLWTELYDAIGQETLRAKSYPSNYETTKRHLIQTVYRIMPLRLLAPR